MTTSSPSSPRPSKRRAWNHWSRSIVAATMLRLQWFQARRLLGLGELGELVVIRKRGSPDRRGAPRYFVHRAAIEAYLVREALKAKAQAVAEAYIAAETEIKAGS